MSDNNNTLGNNKSDIYMISKMIASSTSQNEKNKKQKKQQHREEISKMEVLKHRYQHRCN